MLNKNKGIGEESKKTKRKKGTEKKEPEKKSEKNLKKKFFHENFFFEKIAKNFVQFLKSAPSVDLKNIYNTIMYSPRVTLRML